MIDQVPIATEIERQRLGRKPSATICLSEVARASLPEEPFEN